MSNSIALVAPAVRVIVGVDTHKHVHVAVAIDRLGTRLESRSAPADRGGYAELLAWARTLGTLEAFGIEGTGSYGVGLASFSAAGLGPRPRGRFDPGSCGTMRDMRDARLLYPG